MAVQLTYKTLDPVNLQANASAARKRLSAGAGIALSGLATALLGASVPMLLAACMSAACLQLAVPAAAVCGAVLGALAALLRERGAAPWVALVVFLAGLFGIVALPDARAGLFGLANALIGLWDTAFEGYAGLIVGAPTLAASQLFAVLFGVCAAALAALAVALRSLRVSLVAVVFANACAAVLGSGYTAAGLCLSACGWLLMARLFQLEKAAGGAAAPLADACAIAVPALLVVLACSVLYSPNAVVAQADASLQAGIDSLRYGNDTLPQGNLGRAYTMNDGTESRLEVTASSQLSSNMLLGGFTGATFENGTWQPASHTAYEGDWTGLFSWLESQGLDVNTERATYQDASAEQGGEAYASVDVSVTATGANRKYAFVPYSLQALSGAALEGGTDRGSVARGILGPSSYAFSAYDTPNDDGTQQPTWLEDEAVTGSTSIQAASVYQSFVEETYKDVPAELQSSIDRLFFDKTNWDAEAGSSTYAIVSRVRAILSSNVSYTSTPTPYATTANTDFVTWLLEQERAGNSAYFATAAVLAFRQAGLPARYVEGYRIDADSLEAGQTTTLTAKDAHAWAEVYVDGFGWVPIEVTPGFYEQTYIADEVVPVKETTSDGSDTDDFQAGSVAGDMDDDDKKKDSRQEVSFVEAFLLFVLALVAVLFLACSVGLIVRHVRMTRRERSIASEDQRVCVPALYAYLAACLANSNIGFNEGKPFDCLEEFSQAYPDIDPAELVRVIRLHQDFAFGGRQLRPHELRTLRRFVSRVHDQLPPEKSSLASVRRIFIDAL